MKRINIKTLALALPIISSALVAPAVYAEEIPYGIEYNVAGDVLGEGNVKLLPESLTKIFPKGNLQTKVTKTFSAGWNEGYQDSTTLDSTKTCHNSRYVLAWDGKTMDPISVSVASENYSIVLTIKKIETQGVSENAPIVVGTPMEYNTLYAGKYIYSDEECTQKTTETQDSPDWEIGAEKVFIETEIKLKKNGEEFVHNEIYSGFTDIDSSQSFKILNTSNLITSDNMYTTSIAGLQPPRGDLKNVFVSDGNYIYSQYASGEEAHVPTSQENNVFIPLNVATQEEGLNLVFGFASPAYTTVEFYAHIYVVDYKSDENGEVTGILDEDVFPNENPSSSETTPNKGFSFSYWTANKDVELEDGTIIKKGQPITDEQIKLVKVKEDITFTAVHEKTIPVPDTGSYFIEDNQGAAMIQLSTTVFSVAAVIAFCIARFKHKKVDFRK